MYSVSCFFKFSYSFFAFWKWSANTISKSWLPQIHFWYEFVSCQQNLWIMLFIVIHLKTIYKLLPVYSPDLFTTSLSSSIFLISFPEVFWFYMPLIFFRFGIVDNKSLLRNKLSISEITRFSLKNFDVLWVLLLLCHTFSLLHHIYTNLYWSDHEKFQEC